jgi:uracil phosphoribosyltransferase
MEVLLEPRVVRHPLAAEKLSRLRDETTGREQFRHLMDELSGFLVYEALRDLPTDDVDVRTPLGMAPGVQLHEPPLVVPVLRAGLGMLNPALRLLPNAGVGFVGLRRNESTFEPDPYLTTVPEQLGGRSALVLDPMLATGGSMAHTCQLLAAHGAGKLIVVCILAAPEGVARLAATGLDIQVVTGAVDERLNDQAYIVPGLGDAGDRLYGDL